VVVNSAANVGGRRSFLHNSVSNLALLYDHMGEYGKAEPLYQQTLQIRKKVLGEEHPDTLGTAAG